MAAAVTALASLADRRETLDLLRAYYSLGDSPLRRRFVEFVRQIARAEDTTGH